jgi:DEAD/DEAH box helicase domain-containing protein
MPVTCYLIAYTFSLILATLQESDPVQMLQQAAREHIPVEPYLLGAPTDQNSAVNTGVRPSMDELVQKVTDQDWYREQIVFRKTVDAKQPQFGRLCHQPIVLTH